MRWHYTIIVSILTIDIRCSGIQRISILILYDANTFEINLTYNIVPILHFNLDIVVFEFQPVYFEFYKLGYTSTCLQAHKKDPTRALANALIMIILCFNDRPTNLIKYYQMSKQLIDIRFDIRCIPLFARVRRRRDLFASKFVYKIPYRRAPRLACRPSASREQRYLAYNLNP